MDALPIRYVLCREGTAPYGWWRCLFHSKKTEKSNPNVFPISNTYILESEKKKIGA